MSEALVETTCCHRRDERPDEKNDASGGVARFGFWYAASELLPSALI
jgi:hypothetical protein